MAFSFLHQLSVRNRIWAIVVLLIGGILLASVIDVLMLREALWHERETKTRQLVESGFGVLTHLHEREQKGELSLAAAQAEAIGTIKAMRYDEKEYFWLNDLGTPYPKMIMHPTASTLDGHLLDSAEFNCATGLRSGTEGRFTPTDGKSNLFVAFTEVLKQGAAGYVTYTWPKPLTGGGASEKRYAKLSYVKKFEPWGWVIGSGIYVDDVDAAVYKHAQQTLLMVAGIAMLLLLFATLIARSITQPLQQTITRMRTIGLSDGGLAERLPVKGTSEIAQLAGSFNEMLGHLAARDAALAHHREFLEDEVAHRTVDLLESNTRLAGEQQTLAALLTEMKETQSQLMQSEKMASIGQLAAGVAHEINNPIGFVRSNLATLGDYIKDLIELITAYEQLETGWEKSGQAPSPIREMKLQIDLAFIKNDLAALMTETSQGIDRVARIVQDLKDFSRVDRNDTWERADLHKGLDSTINLLWSEIRNKCELKKEYADLPPVECLPSLLNQVFLNLLLNAAQSIETHGIITLRSGVKDDQVWLEVADTGSGIAPDKLPRIFDPFFTTRPIGKGTGLGLSVAYSIIKKHHGRIEVDSQPGVGTTFRICLPLRQPDNNAA